MHLSPRQAALRDARDDIRNIKRRAHNVLLTVQHSRTDTADDRDPARTRRREAAPVSPRPMSLVHGTRSVSGTEVLHRVPTSVMEEYKEMRSRLERERHLERTTAWDGQGVFPEKIVARRDFQQLFPRFAASVSASTAPNGTLGVGMDTRTRQRHTARLACLPTTTGQAPRLREPSPVSNKGGGADGVSPRMGQVTASSSKAIGTGREGAPTTTLSVLVSGDASLVPPLAALFTSPEARTDEHRDLIAEWLQHTDLRPLLTAGGDVVGKCRALSRGFTAREHAPDEIICEEGLPADSFLCVLFGVVGVRKGGLVLRHAGIGECFGVNSLTAVGCTRAEGLVTVERSALACLRVSEYREALSSYNEHRVTKYSTFLMNQCPALKSMSRTKMRDFARQVTIRQYAAGTRIMRQGDIAGAIFIVSEGECVVEAEVTYITTNRWPKALEDWEMRAVTLQRVIPVRVLGKGAVVGLERLENINTSARNLGELQASRLVSSARSMEGAEVQAEPVLMAAEEASDSAQESNRPISTPLEPLETEAIAAPRDSEFEEAADVGLLGKDTAPSPDGDPRPNLPTRRYTVVARTAVELLTLEHRQLEALDIMLLRALRAQWKTQCELLAKARQQVEARRALRQEGRQLMRESVGRKMVQRVTADHKVKMAAVKSTTSPPHPARTGVVNSGPSVRLFHR